MTSCPIHSPILLSSSLLFVQFNSVHLYSFPRRPTIDGSPCLSHTARPGPPPSLHTHTHTHTRTHAHTDAHTHTHTHTHTRARMHTRTHTRTHTDTHSSAAAMVMREGTSKGEGWRAQKEKGRSFSCNSITGGPVFFTNGKSVYLLFFFPPVGFPPCCLRPFSPLASTPPLLTSSFSFKSISHYALKRDVQRCVK